MKYLVLESTEVLNEGTDKEYKLCKFGSMAKSELSGKLRKVIGSRPTSYSILPLRFNLMGELIENEDFTGIEDFIGDEVPGMVTQTYQTTPFKFKGETRSEFRTSLRVITTDNRSTDAAALYALRELGVTFVGVNGDQLTSSTKAEWDLRKIKASNDQKQRRIAAGLDKVESVKPSK